MNLLNKKIITVFFICGVVLALSMVPRDIYAATSTVNPLDPLLNIERLFFGLMMSLQQTTNNNANLPVPTPNPSITTSPTSPQDVIAVAKLVENIQNTCGPINLSTCLVNENEATVTSSKLANSTTCLKNFQPPTDQAVPEITNSTNAYQNLQCVGFVKAIVKMNTGIDWGTVGNAINLPHDSPPPEGYTFIYKQQSRIQIGDIPVWNYDTYGHVGYVVEVYDPNLFRVAEANWCNDGDVNDTRKTTVDDSYLLGWLRKI